jgi:hypothetical protein
MCQCITALRAHVTVSTSASWLYLLHSGAAMTCSCIHSVLLCTNTTTTATTTAATTTVAFATQTLYEQEWIRIEMLAEKLEKIEKKKLDKGKKREKIQGKPKKSKMRKLQRASGKALV